MQKKNQNNTPNNININAGTQLPQFIYKDILWPPRDELYNSNNYNDTLILFNTIPKNLFYNCKTYYTKLNNKHKNMNRDKYNNNNKEILIIMKEAYNFKNINKIVNMTDIRIRILYTIIYFDKIIFE